MVSQPFEAGRLQYFVKEWRKLTNDSHVLDIVQHCHLNIPVDDISHLFHEDIEYIFSEEDKGIVCQEISQLLELQVIRETSRFEGQILSPVFLRKKKDGGVRMILNLEKLNTHIPYQHFKMENFAQAIRLINKGDYMASVDLRHAYYTIKIAEEQQRFLCFKWQGRIYQFTCLPNGIAEGPRLFTKLMKPVYAKLREMGHVITSFIDDTLIAHSTLSGCFESVNATVQMLKNLGFCINEDKSLLIPTTRLEYLGNVIDSVSMTVTLPERRKCKLIRSCEELYSCDKARIRDVARVIGLLVAALPAVEMGKLHYRKLESAKISALQKVKGNFNKWMAVTDDMRSDLSWWLNNITLQTRHIFRSGTELDLYTDASNLGWGGSLNGRQTNGRWSSLESDLHINAKELRAILLTLQSFTDLLRGKHIRVFCDNMTAVHYVNEMGGTRSAVCNDISLEIWDWCEKNEAWITCSHVPGAVNLLADAASRKFQDRHDWKLNEDIFQELCTHFGVPSIDLFASRLNKQVPRFCSWQPDPEAEFIDAFSINWSQFELIYAFPPFALIARCLQKLRAEVARGWLIVPLWPSQPWMSVLLRLLIREPLLLPRRRYLLRHPSTLEEHPIMSHTRLMACLLSGNSCENAVYLRRARTSSWLRGGPQPRSSIDHTFIGGYSFAVGNASIPLIPL